MAKRRTAAGRLVDRRCGKIHIGVKPAHCGRRPVAMLIFAQSSTKLATRSVDLARPFVSRTVTLTFELRRIATNWLIVLASGRSNGNPATGLYGIKLTCAPGAQLRAGQSASASGFLIVDTPQQNILIGNLAACLLKIGIGSFNNYVQAD